MTDFNGAKNTIQAIVEDFSSDGMLDEYSRIDHQHPLSPTIQSKLNSVGYRNIVQNGQFNIRQRIPNDITIFGAAAILADRWFAHNNGVGQTDLYYSNTSAFGSGFFPIKGRPIPPKLQSIYVRTAEAAGSLSAGDYLIYRHSIEGINVQHLNYGTINAKPLVVSFDCYSTVAATYIVELENANSGGTTKTISRPFSVPAGIFTTISVNFPGDTALDLNNTTGAELLLTFWLAAGSTYTSGTLATNWETFTNANRAVGISNTYQATVGNYFMITNVQMEVGVSPSGYEVRPYFDELQEAMRYYEAFNNLALGNNQYKFGVGLCISSTQAVVLIPFKVRKRALPGTAVYASANTFFLYTAVAAAATCTVITTNTSSDDSLEVIATVSSGLVAGNSTMLASNTTLGTIRVSAEI